MAAETWKRRLSIEVLVLVGCLLASVLMETWPWAPEAVLARRVEQLEQDLGGRLGTAEHAALAESTYSAPFWIGQVVGGLAFGALLYVVIAFLRLVIWALRYQWRRPSTPVALAVLLTLVTPALSAGGQDKPRPAAAKPAVFKLVELLRQDGERRQVFNATLTLDADRLTVAPYSRRNKFEAFVIPYTAITSATIADGTESSGMRLGWITTSSETRVFTIHTATKVVVLKFESESPLVVAEFQSRSGVKVVR